MLRNYFTLAVRNFRKHKVFSLINILGLAVGISASLVIFLIVQYEFSFDRFHKDGDRIYRVVSNLNFSGSTFENSGVPAPLPDALRTEIPGVEKTVAFHLYDYNVKVLINKGNGQEPLRFKDRKNIIFAGPQYFDLFNYQWLAGSPDVLKEPGKVVLSESRAKEYFTFPDITKAVGQIITYNDSVNVTVAGIVKDWTTTSDFTFREFIALSTIPNTGLKNNYNWDAWNNFNSSSQCFIMLKKGASVDQVAKKITTLLYDRGDKDPSYTSKEMLQPLNDLHFNSKYDVFGQRQANMPTLYGLLLVASFLLILGCINFINLTTAQAAQRAKEIGIRKTMGSNKRQLIAQFLSETTLLTVAATLLSVALVPSLLKLFGNYIPEGLSFTRIFQPGTLLFLLVLVAAVSLLSGFYPSLILSRFKPVQVLKNQAYSNTGKTRNAWLRKTLTVSQFMIAQFLIIGTLMVAKQIHFSLNKDLGYRKDAIVNINAPWTDWKTPQNKQLLLNKLKSIPELQQVCLAGKPPASSSTSSSTLKFDDGKKVVEKMVEIRHADAEYFKFYNLKLIAGTMPQPSDTVRKEYLVNEAYARTLGYTHPQDIVGKSIVQDDKKRIPIVGVLADFHTKSLHQAIAPLAYAAQSDQYSTFHILLQPQQEGGASWKQAIAKMEKAWKEVYPNNDFSYSFFDESIAKFYKTEQSTSRLLTWASGLAIFISCLGLLGLVIFTTHQRVKEIGVRKVLGASVTQIVSLLSKDFILLVILAFIITVPLAWWAASTWLQSFAYRTNMPWWIFVAGGGIMIVLALLTLSFQTIRSALANPVKALRSE